MNHQRVSLVNRRYCLATAGSSNRNPCVRQRQTKAIRRRRHQREGDLQDADEKEWSESNFKRDEKILGCTNS